MKNYLLCFVLICFLFSCKGKAIHQSKSDTTSELQSDTEQMANSDQNSYFNANGNEPFWNVKIDENNIRFSSLSAGFEIFNSPHVDPSIAQDANVKKYSVSTELGEMTIEIKHQSCTNSMSGALSNYFVSVAIKRGIDKDFTIFKGCGNYITDYRLHDLWVLESINGSKVTVADFSDELPRLEINAAKNQFIGFSGCNSISGTLFFEKELLRFKNSISTHSYCESPNKESDFLKALQSTISYSIGNNKLKLTNPSGVELVFKKVD